MENFDENLFNLENMGYKENPFEGCNFNTNNEQPTENDIIVPPNSQNPCVEIKKQDNRTLKGIISEWDKTNFRIYSVIHTYDSGTIKIHNGLSKVMAEKIVKEIKAKNKNNNAFVVVPLDL